MAVKQILDSKFQKSNIRLSFVAIDYQNTNSVGHVTIGPRTSGKELGHWQRLLLPHDRPIMMSHYIKPKIRTQKRD